MADTQPLGTLRARTGSHRLSIVKNALVAPATPARASRVRNVRRESMIQPRVRECKEFFQSPVFVTIQSRLTFGYPAGVYTLPP